ncbi:MAG: hypothetical protein PHR06_08590 [Candidatus Cloacimonetes bacterium]|nr:hypothetical protein [Candidatus Cloacimonadota bacterium]
MLRVLQLFLIVCFIAGILFAQESDNLDILDEDSILEVSETNLFLEKLKHDPIRINSATEAELQELPFLEKSDLRKIINFRAKRQFTKSRDLLEAGLSDRLVETLEMYISYKKRTKVAITAYSLNRIKHNEDTDINSSRNLNKLFVTYGNFDLFFLSDKDPGEKQFSDFYSYSLSYSGNSFLKYAVLGKYRISTGQGLLFASKLATSKTAFIGNPLKTQTVKPYTSSFEMWDMEGGAAVFKFRQIELMPFYSNTKYDATLQENKISSFREDGLHISNKYKNNVGETIGGINLQHQSEWFNWSVLSSFNRFDREFVNPEYKSEYNATSFAFKISLFRINLFGEASYTMSKKALIGGLYLGEGSFRQNLVFRYYEKYFPTWHGNPLSTQSSFDNEQGFFYSLMMKPLHFIELQSYFDVWKCPETRYYEKMPTTGNEEYLRIKLKITDSTIGFAFKRKQNEKYSVYEDDGRIRDVSRNVFRIDWTEKINKYLHIRFCHSYAYENNQTDSKYKTGNLSYIQSSFQLRNLLLVNRLTIFKSDVLQYLSESSVEGSSDFRIFSGEGTAFYTLIRLKVKKHFDMQFKYYHSVSDNSSDQISVFFRAKL